jgi:hypothetical protein
VASQNIGPGQSQTSRLTSVPVLSQLCHELTQCEAEFPNQRLINSIGTAEDLTRIWHRNFSDL